MKLTPHLAPHIRSAYSSRTVMGDAIITLGALYIMAGFYYGERALMLGAVSVLTCVTADMVCCLLRRHRVTFVDLSAVVTGLLLPLLMPASIPYRVVIVAGLFAILVVKQPFGGVGSNIFNPAAGGFAFVIVCWSKELFAYPMPFGSLPLWGEVTAPLYSSTAYTMYVGGIPQIAPQNLLMGLAPGPMGTTNILVLGACMLYLTLRRTIRVQQPFFLLVAVALVAYLNPRTGAAPWASVFYELTAMPTIFAATFLFSDPVTTPSRATTKAVYAFAAGLVLMAFRYTGGYEFTEPFAILAMNALTPAFDSLAEAINTWMRRKALETQTLETEPSFGDEEEE